MSNNLSTKILLGFLLQVNPQLENDHNLLISRVELKNMDCRVNVEAAIKVYDVETENQAVDIAISKVGDMLNPDLNYVEIETRDEDDPHDPAYIVADEALVGLELEMTVFNVEEQEHAERVARKEIGQRLENIPLEVTEVEVTQEGEDEEKSYSDDQNEDDEELSEPSTSDEADDETLPELDNLGDE